LPTGGYYDKIWGQSAQKKKRSRKKKQLIRDEEVKIKLCQMSPEIKYIEKPDA